MLAKYKQ